MMRRNIGVVLSLVGLLAVLGGVLAGLFGNSNSSRSATIEPKTPYVYTVSGVLDQVEGPVTFTLTSSSDAEIFYALGTPVDVQSWAEGLAATKVTSLAPKEKFTSETTEAAQDLGEIPSLTSSDMWLESGKGKGEVSKTYRVETHGTISLIATTSKGTAPTLELSWQPQGKARGSIPVILIGLLTLLVGGALVFLHEQDRRRSKQRQAVRERKIARRAARAQANTDVLSLEEIIGSPRSTQIATTGGALGAGIVMGSPRAEEFRARELPEEERILLDLPEVEESQVQEETPLQSEEARAEIEASTTAQNAGGTGIEENPSAAEESESVEASQEMQKAGDEKDSSHEVAADSDGLKPQDESGYGLAESEEQDTVSDSPSHEPVASGGQSEHWRNRWYFALNDEPTKED